MTTVSRFRGMIQVLYIYIKNFVLIFGIEFKRFKKLDYLGEHSECPCKSVCICKFQIGEMN